MPVRVIVDALGASFGGIRTYVENLLAAWPEARPEDELIVITNAAHELQIGEQTLVVPLDVVRPEAVGRVLQQSWLTPRLVRRFGPDVVLATHPSPGLLPHGAPLTVVVHDLRHELRPSQFSRARRLARHAAYSRAYSMSAATISVSERTRKDLLALHPSLAQKPNFVVPHGADHAISWPGEPRSGPAVTFAHHSNKNSHLVIDAWALARERGVEVPPLAVLGGSAQRAQLTDRAKRRGVAHLVTVHDWLAESEFRELFGTACLVVMSSDFEGFGLPVVEAMVRGTPVVIAADRALIEVAGGHASMMSDWTPEALATCVETALKMGEDAIENARKHAARFTWRRTVLATATALGSVCQ